MSFNELPNEIKDEFAGILLARTNLIDDYLEHPDAVMSRVEELERDWNMLELSEDVEDLTPAQVMSYAVGY